MLVAMPMTDKLVNIVCKIIPTKETNEKDNSPYHLYFLDEQMLRTPVVAVRQLKAEVENMSKLAIENFRRSIYIVKTLDYSNINTFRETEKELNFLNRELVKYAVRLSDSYLNRFDHQYLVSTIRTVSDLERIGDYAENIVEYADSLKQQNLQFSQYALSEIDQMEQLINDLYDQILLAYHKLDLAALGRANQIEDEIDRLTDEMEHNHIQRLALNICSPQVGTEYISLAQNSERIADHLINMGKTIKELKAIND